ncbi:MAG: FecR family protein [Prolixibacteraceae bacterium]|nr:FecR family protein [Prolixibacteraceae bacterium]
MEKKILSSFIANKKMSAEELSQLLNWISDNRENSEVNTFLKDEWNNKDEKETQIQFSDIKKKIPEREKVVKKNTVLRQIITSYQKAVAIILLPVVAFSIYFIVNQFNTEPTYFQTTAETGQKSNLVLPDGTKVWLNSDSKIKYPDNFGKKNRSVELTGEAYFEVVKDTKNPFWVEAGEVQIRVLGTSFNLKAYTDENKIETTLFEGKVELTVHANEKRASKTIEMKPGQFLSFNKVKNELQYKKFENDEVLAWKNNQLIFRNDSFENLVRKIERWYNVEIIYDEANLNKQRLTVELYEGELLYRLLDIIELAMDVECISEKDKIYIKSKNEK